MHASLGIVKPPGTFIGSPADDLAETWDGKKLARTMV